MAQRITHLFSCPDVFARLASAAGAALVSWRQDGVAAALRDVKTKLYEIVNVEDYAAAGDVDDTLMIQRAGAEIRRRGGGTLWFKHGKTYTVFTAAGDTTLLNMGSMKGVTIEGNGCTLQSARVNTSSIDFVVAAAAAENLVIRGFKFSGGNTSLLAAGERFVIYGGGCKNLRVTDCYLENAQGGVQCIDTGTQNSGIYVDIYCYRVFYPLSTYNTDDLKANLVTRSCGRSYFPTAPCHNHTVNIDSQSGFTDADVILHVAANGSATLPEYTNAISNITINYTSKGRAAGSGNQSSAQVYLSYMQAPAGVGVTNGAAIMRNIRVNFDMNGLNASGSAADKPSNLFQMTKRNADGTADGDPRGHILDGLVISGSVINWNNSGGGGVVICDGTTGSGAGAGWTGDLISGIALRDLRIEGVPPNDAIYVNGQGAIAGAPFLTLDNVYVDGTLTYANVTNARIAQRNVKASNVPGASNKPLAYTPTWTGSGGNPAIVDGSLGGMYAIADGMCDAQIIVVPGASTTFGSGNYAFSLPVACAADGMGAIGVVEAINSGSNYEAGTCRVLSGGSTVDVKFAGASTVWTPTGPWTFKNGDYAIIRIRYPVA